MARYDYWPRFGLDNYSLVLPYENTFNSEESTTWMQKNWLHSFSWSAAYLVFIFSAHKYMESRKPFSLELLLFFWNAGLAIFSILGFLRMTPEWLWSVSSPNSFSYSVCVASFAQGVSGFWTELFAMSKVVELGDTVFIIARKRPLLFLHWYHHITVLVYTWHAYKDHTASGRWFIWMNYGVHAFMYSYYAFRSLKLRTPKSVAMVITILQISQMVAGVIIGVTVFRIKSSGGACQQTWENLGLNMFVYFTYFLLFCNFFYHTYLKQNNRYAVAVDKKETDTTRVTVASDTVAKESENNNEPKANGAGVATRRRVQKAD